MRRDRRYLPGITPSQTPPALVLCELGQYNAQRVLWGIEGHHVNYGQIVCLGLGLLVGSTSAFAISWTVLGRLKNNVRIVEEAVVRNRMDKYPVERNWFRCLATCFYVGLVILLASALGSIIQNTVKGSK